MDDNEYINSKNYSDEIEEELDSQMTDSDIVSDEEPVDNAENFDMESDDLDSSTGRINDSYKKVISSNEEKELQQKLVEKIEELKEADKEVARTQAFGDLSENEAYEHAKKVVSELHTDINKIQYELSHSVVEDNENSDKVIGRSSKVHLTISSKTGYIEPQEITVMIVSAGHGEIMESGEVRIPDTSEVFNNMKDKQSGYFDMSGTDGKEYHYEFEIIRG